MTKLTFIQFLEKRTLAAELMDLDKQKRELLALIQTAESDYVTMRDQEHMNFNLLLVEKGLYNYILYNYSNHHTSGEHGIERKTPHATRHTYASRAVKEGLPPEMLQKILGHADYSTTTNIYTHIDAQTLVDAVTNTLLTNKK